MSRAPKRLQRFADKMVAGAWHNGVTVSLYDREIAREMHVSSGELGPRTPYFSSGISVLYTTAILLQLREEGKIDFDQPFLRYMSNPAQLAELHVKDGVDYTDQVTIQHLMSHTSGFGDFFLFKNHARGWRHDVGKGVDSAWGFDEVLARTRSYGAVAVPGDPRRAHYTDTNFHLLGRVIEDIEGQSFADVVQDRVIDRLGLQASYVYCDPSDNRPLDLMSRQQRIHVPHTMASLQADGGIVTTSREAMIFARGFFEGYLFDKRILPHLYQWKPMFYPSEFGIGMMQLQLPRWMALPHRLRYRPQRIFLPLPRLLGNTGIGGSFCFYAPERGIYLAGTVNQLHEPVRAVTFAVHALEDALYEARPAHLSELRRGPLSQTPMS